MGTNNNITTERRAVLKEAIWKMAEKNMLRRERQRLIRKGRLTPAWGMKPQMMVKVDGQWRPHVGVAA